VPASDGASGVGADDMAAALDALSHLVASASLSAPGVDGADQPAAADAAACALSGRDDATQDARRSGGGGEPRENDVTPRENDVTPRRSHRQRPCLAERPRRRPRRCRSPDRRPPTRTHEPTSHAPTTTAPMAGP